MVLDKTDKHIGILGAMYCPDRGHPPEPRRSRAGEHTDFRALPILRPGDAPSDLQIIAKAGDRALVKAPPGASVANVGDLMAR